LSCFVCKYNSLWSWPPFLTLLYEPWYNITHCLIWGHLCWGVWVSEGCSPTHTKMLWFFIGHVDVWWVNYWPEITCFMSDLKLWKSINAVAIITFY
jgi:hypothetical protein